MFRRGWFDYLFRIGILDAATAKDPPIEQMWVKQRAQMEHLAATAAEDWVALFILSSDNRMRLDRWMQAQGENIVQKGGRRRQRCHPRDS